MLFTFLVGVLVGVVSSAIATTVWFRVGKSSSASRRYVLAGAFIVAFATVAGTAYLVLGTRHTDVRGATNTAASAAPSMGTPSDGATPAAKSMDAAVAGLEARLASGQGSDADWTLLAQAYDFLGRPEDARRARAKTLSPKTAPVAPMSAATLAQASASFDAQRGAPAGTPSDMVAPQRPLAELELEAKNRPTDPRVWVALADARRVQRDYDGARLAFQKVIELRAMTAPLWADYADTLASLDNGSLGGPAGAAIDQALALDPANAKALWLKASQAHEQRRYGDALTWWQKLKRSLPPDSSDTRIIDGNIAEDTALAKDGGGVRAQPSTPAAAISGTVSIDARLLGRVTPDATLFIYAKAADSPGPPLAVMRTSASHWPVAFQLDDSMAMIPTRRLSQFDKVVIEARVSKSGQAMPVTGDFYARSPVLQTRPATRLALTIDHEIG